MTKFALKGLFTRKLRTVLTALAIVLGVAMISGTYVLTDSIDSAFDQIFTDVREKLRMEARLSSAQEELREQEKSLALAELAGTTAHELNQPLTGVIGYAELLMRQLTAESPLYSAAEVILSESQRMAGIVRKIGKITRYETRSYLGGTKILDLDKAAPESSDPVGSGGEG